MVILPRVKVNRGTLSKLIEVWSVDPRPTLQNTRLVYPKCRGNVSFDKGNKTYLAKFALWETTVTDLKIEFRARHLELGAKMATESVEPYPEETKERLFLMMPDTCLQ